MYNEHHPCYKDWLGSPDFSQLQFSGTTQDVAGPKVDGGRVLREKAFMEKHAELYDTLLLTNNVFKVI